MNGPRSLEISFCSGGKVSAIAKAISNYYFLLLFLFYP